MFKELKEELKVQSWKARQLSSELGDVANDFKSRMAKIERQVFVEVKETKPIDTYSIKLNLIKIYKDFYLEIFKKEILDAEFKSIEYTRKHRFFTQLAEVVENNIDFLLKSLVEGGIADARLTMEMVAGDFSDFIEGVIIARDVISGLSEQNKQLLAFYNLLPSKERRDWTWKNVVWPDDNYYDRTINIRFTAWGNKAPYWVLLDEGNEQYEGAFPKFTATNFFYQACQKIIINLEERVNEYRKESVGIQTTETNIRQEIQEIVIKVSELINKATKEVLDNPGRYQPGFVFQYYKDAMDNFIYKVYVTPTGIVGVRKVK